MTHYPVEYHARRPEHFSVLQLALRVVAFCLLGMLGLSFGLVFLFLYLALPAYAASRIQSYGADKYLSDDGPRVLWLLRWFAAISAWAGLVVDRFPQDDPAELVALSVAHMSISPNPGSALIRVLTGLPNALFLALVGFVGTMVWIWAALSVLFVHRVGAGAHLFLEGVQRVSVRLLVYQASLVDAYPPTSLHDDTSAPGFPTQA